MQKTIAPSHCFFNAQHELLSIRAGMPTQYVQANRTLEMMVKGSHELCKAAKGEKNSPVSCPGANSVSQLDTIGETSIQDFLASSQCRDEDVLLTVVQETCMAGHFAKSFPPLSLVFNSQRKRCSDFAALCRCTSVGGCGPTSPLYRDAAKKGIPGEWIHVIQGICPETCGTCKGEDPLSR